MPSPLLVKLIVQFSLTTRAWRLCQAAFGPFRSIHFQRIETRCVDRLRILQSCDPSKVGHPYQTVLTGERKGLVAALSLSDAEYSMTAGIVNRDGTVIV